MNMSSELILTLPIAAAERVAYRISSGLIDSFTEWWQMPALVLGVVASAALIKRRRWGRVVAIVALALALAVTLGYGIVWLVLVPLGRPLVAVILGLLSVAQVLLLIYWSLPRPWWWGRGG